MDDSVTKIYLKRSKLFFSSNSKITIVVKVSHMQQDYLVEEVVNDLLHKFSIRFGTEIEMFNGEITKFKPFMQGLEKYIVPV